MQGFFDAQFSANQQTDFARRLQRRDQRTWDLLVERNLAVLDGLEGDIGGHDFGQRGGVPLAVKIFGVEQFAVGWLKQQRWARENVLHAQHNGEYQAQNWGYKKRRSQPHLWPQRKTEFRR